MFKTLKIEKLIRNSKLEIKNSQSAFTLVEVLIYSAVLAIFIGASFAFISAILGNADNLLERNEVIVNQTFLERKIKWLTGRATQVSAPAPNGFGTTTVTFEGSDVSVYPATLSLLNNEIGLSLGGGTSTPITNNRVKITGFSANHYSSAQSTSTLKILVTFQSRVYPNIIVTSTIFYASPL